MPPRPAIEQLPPEVRSALEMKLIQSAFSGLQDLSEWLANHGYDISVSAIGRHSAKLQKLRARAQERKAIVDAMGGDLHAYSMGVMVELLQRAEDLIEDMDDETTATEVSKLSRAIKDMGQMLRESEKHSSAAEIERRKALTDLERQAKGEGMSGMDALKRVREIYGIYE